MTWHPERYLRPAGDTQHARIPLRWMTSPAYRVLSGSAQSALLALAGLLSGPGGVEWGQASYSEIAAYAVTCRRSAINAVQELRAYGWLDLETTTTKYGSRDANRYRVIPPSDLGPGKNQVEKPSEAAAPRQPSEGEQLAAEWYAAYRPDASPSRSEKVLAGRVVQKFGLDTARNVLRQAMKAAKGWIPNIFGGLRPYIRPFLDGTRPAPAAAQPAAEPAPEDQAGVEALHALGKLQALVLSLSTEVDQLPRDQAEGMATLRAQLAQSVEDIAVATNLIAHGEKNQVRWCPAALEQAQAAIQAAQAALGHT